MKKRILSVAVAVLMLMSLFVFAACDSEGDYQAYAAGDSLKPYEPAIRITYTNPMDLTSINMVQTLGFTQEDTMWTRLYKDRLGIKLMLDSETTQLAGYVEKLTSKQAADTLPDLILTGSGDWSYTFIKTMYEQEQLADLSDAYEKLATDELKAHYNEAGDEIWQPAKFGGKLYALPQIIGSENEVYSFYHIRKDWLDALNLPVPGTFDELIETARAFTTNDPDRNGRDDTYGFSFGGDFRKTASLFFAAYDSYPTQWVEKDGKLVYGSTQPETKEALSKLRDLYSAGVINPDFMNTTEDQLYTAFNQNTAGIFMGKVYYGLLLNDGYRLNPDFEVVAVYAMHSDGGDAKLMLPSNAANYYVMNSSCRQPEAIVKMFNLYFDVRTSEDEETQNTYIYTPAGQQVSSISPIKTDIIGTNYKRASNIKQALQSGDGSGLLPVDKSVYDNVKKFIDGGSHTLWGWNFIYGENGTEYLMGKYLENDLLIPATFNAAKTDSMQLHEADLLAMELGGFSLIINGEEPLDSFDMLVASWMDGGGSDIVNEVNAWYSEYKSK